MIKVKLQDGKKKKTVYVPSSWRQVSFEQMVELQKGGDPVAVFSQIPLKRWESVEAQSYADFAALLTFLSEAPKWGNPMTLIIQGKEIDFKKVDIRTEDAGQYIDAQNVLQKYYKGGKKRKIKDLNECLPEIIAIYAQKVLCSEYDYKQVDSLKEEIKALPYERVLAIGNFFLISLSKLSNGRGILYRLWISLMRKGGPVRKLFTKNGVIMQPFTISLSK